MAALAAACAAAPVAPVAAAHAAGPRGLLLAVDTSASMAGRPLRDATAAARDLVAALRPPGVAGVAVFDTRLRVVVPLGPAPRRWPVSALRADSGTHLVDAVATGVRRLRRAARGGGTLVVLTDGAGGSGRTPLGALARLSALTGVRVQVVGVGAARRAGPRLWALAVAGGGTYVRAGTSAEVRTAVAAAALPAHGAADAPGTDDWRSFVAAVLPAAAVAVLVALAIAATGGRRAPLRPPRAPGRPRGRVAR